MATKKPSQASGQAAGPSKRQQAAAKSKKPRAQQIGERVVKAIEFLNPFD